ncbi:dipeptide/oligopeptide/nickel ABC transporter permease/ATP-binding protein [Streptomyces sp. NPDC004539]|uniref:dipeptide/oligopeptide/nickel ABC transporter permease/ATP-binding protein n=1 Tax=Streptomyces sp. NPDC004539 TaxID=3154280 RepID=UPI0033B1277F
MTTEKLAADVSGAARRGLLHRLRRDPQAVATALVVAAYVVAGLIAPLVAPHEPNAASLDAVNAPIGTAGHLLGGDASGRDILSRLLYSVRTSLVAGAIGAGVALIVGVSAGLVGGYFGRRVRVGTEWLFNLIMTFPGLLLLIVLFPVTGGDLRVTMLIFGVLLSTGIYRIVRNLVLGVKNELFVDAARVAGLSDVRILSKHVFLVIRGPVTIAAAFMVGTSIALQAGLAFLGLGSNTVPSFGSMISQGFTNLYTQPIQFVWPSLGLGILTASLVLFGNALRDAFEGPRPQRISARRRRAMKENRAVPELGPATGLLEIRDLAIAYPTPSGELREVVRGIDLSVSGGETVGLVGESGSGKTQTAFATLGVLPQEALVTRGSIRLDGVEVLDLPERELSRLRGSVMAYIPQEPMSNLDPSYTIGSQLTETLRHSAGIGRRQARERVLRLLERCGIREPLRVFHAYPHQISGGMAQRALIAAAVAGEPKLLIADEPTTALDVTVQAEILDLLRDLRDDLGVAILLVTHNFGVVADLCDRIAVMSDGKIVETGQTRTVFREPRAPYTRSLLDSILDEMTVRTDPPAPAPVTAIEESRS